jgi:hypothetical protein
VRLRVHVYDVIPYQVLQQYAAITRESSAKRASRTYRAGVGYGGSTFSMFATYALLFWYGSQLVRSGQVCPVY